MQSTSDHEKLFELRVTRTRRDFGPAGASAAEISEGYRLSLALAELQGGDIAAWKLGATTAATRLAFATQTVYFGPILRCEIIDRPNYLGIDMKPFRGEAEIALRLARNIGMDEAVDIEMARDSYFDAFAPAIECPWSVVKNLPQAGLKALLMDRCAAGLLIIGEISPFGAVGMDGLLEIIANGQVLASGTPSRDLLMSPTEAAYEAIRQIGLAGLGLRKGQWISTGGVTACVDLPMDGQIELRYSGKTQFLATREFHDDHG